MQDYANQLAQMLVGWQITVVDIPRLTPHGAGEFAFELLEESSTLDGQPTEPFSIEGALRHWLTDAIRRDQIGEDFIQRITVEGRFLLPSREHSASPRDVLVGTVTVFAENGTWIGSSAQIG